MSYNINKDCEKLIHQYLAFKDDQSQLKQTVHSKNSILKSSMYESWDMFKKITLGFISFFGTLKFFTGLESFISLLPEIKLFSNIDNLLSISLGKLTTSLVILIFIYVGCFIHSYIKFSKNVYKKELKGLSLEIKIDDYIVNMIQLLFEYKNKSHSKLLFAMGMNQKKLEEIYENPNLSEKNNLVSVSHDFFEFSKLLGINPKKEIYDCLKKHGGIYKQGDVFSIDYTITNANDDFCILNGLSFTIIFYVNSNNEVEDGRETVFHLVDFMNDFIFQQITKNSGKKLDFIAMIPAIGTGETGRAPFKNILIEIINNLSIRNYLIPNKVVLSLRELELFESDYEVSSLLRLAKKIYSQKK